jgi:uncharacterized protein (DUF885 family)
MRGWFVLGAMVGVIWGSARAVWASEEPEDARLEALFRDYLEETFRHRPMMATRLGDHRFDDRLDDVSPEARRADLERRRRLLEELPKRVNLERLSPDGQVDYEILRRELERSIWLDETFDTYREDPRVWNEYLTESVYLLLTQSTRPQSENRANAVKRMAEIPRVAAQARATIAAPHRVHTETAIGQTQGAIAFYEDLIYDLAGVPKGDPEVAQAAAPVVEALRSHLAFLKETALPASRDDAWRIGRAAFARKLELELDAGLSADEVLAEAEAEADRVLAEMATVARLLWGTYYPDEPIPPDDEAGRRTLIGRVLARIGDERSTPEGVVDDVRAQVDQIKAFIRDRRILRLPEPDRCTILEMPEFMRGNSTAYLNAAAPLDPDGRSEYAVSPPPAHWTPEQIESYFREYNLRMLKILTIHEAYPGHYVQLEYANRVPRLIRRVVQSGPYVEGWAVYTEQMMLDQGFGDGDPALRLQQLKFYLRAVLNAILDHRMHCEELSDAEAMRLLVERGFQTEGEALGKVIRAKQSSVQLSTYFVGRVAHYRLRQAIQRELGERFDLAAYHEAVLNQGSVPVRHLPGLVRRALGLSEGGAAAPAR